MTSSFFYYLLWSLLLSPHFLCLCGVSEVNWASQVLYLWFILSFKLSCNVWDHTSPGSSLPLAYCCPARGQCWGAVGNRHMPRAIVKVCKWHPAPSPPPLLHPHHLGPPPPFQAPGPSHTGLLLPVSNGTNISASEHVPLLPVVVCMAWSLMSFKCLLKCHLITETFPEDST